jgi:hypothetical protein
MATAVNDPFLSLDNACCLMQYAVHNNYPGIVTTNAVTHSLDTVCPARKTVASIKFSDARNPPEISWVSAAILRPRHHRLAPTAPEHLDLPPRQAQPR